MSDKILLVEDEHPLRETIARGLRRTGFEVIEASDGDTAIEAINKGVAADALVTDVQMPGKTDGAGVVEHALKADPEIPVVIMSGDTGDVRLPSLGRQGTFLQKPFSVYTLVFVVKELLHFCRSKFHLRRTA